jgi:hypothetical protein
MIFSLILRQLNLNTKINYSFRQKVNKCTFPFIWMLCVIQKPTAQTAHLVFAEMNANAKMQSIHEHP